MSDDASVAATDNAAHDGVWSAGRRALTAGLVCTITLVGFEGLAIATVMPVVSRDLHDIGLYGWVFSAFFLGNLLGIVSAGRSADRVGPARPFVIGLALFGAGLLAGGLAPNMAVLVAARTVQGIGAGAIPAVAYVAIGRAYPAALQPRMFAVISSAWVLPGVIGPAISGAIADAVGWRWVFLGLLPLVVASGTVAAPALRAIAKPDGPEPDDKRAQALLLAVGAALVLAGASARSILLAPPLVIVGAFVGARAFMRLMPTGTTKFAPGTPAAVALRGLFTFAFFGTDAYVSLTLTSLRGTSTTLAGIALTGATMTWTAGAWIQERRIHHVDARRFVRIGAVLIAAGIALMIVTAEFAVPIAVAVAAWAIAGLGMGLSYAPVSLIVLAEAPPGREGTMTASLQLNETLGVALGTGASGAIVAAGAALDASQASTLSLAFGMCIVVAVVAAAFAQRLPSTVRADTPAPSTML